MAVDMGQCLIQLLDGLGANPGMGAVVGGVALRTEDRPEAAGMHLEGQVADPALDLRALGAAGGGEQAACRLEIG
ncbi:hypothetical protein D3C78_1348600 [compost metagenome]